MTDTLAEKVYSFAEENALFSGRETDGGSERLCRKVSGGAAADAEVGKRPACRVVLGLSGGADSMALLHLLTHWPAAARPMAVTAVHVHHGIRGAEADADAAFVREQCAGLGVPLRLVHADVPAMAAARHDGLEETGRRVRYAAFEEAREAVGAEFILTAHTASDQAETVLMHLIRGCGVSGLTGIPVRRGFVRRPLLCCTRPEIEAYCHENAIPFRTDSTNADTGYRRNAVRHQLLPLLRSFNPSVDEALLRLAANASEDEDCLTALAGEALRQAKTADGAYDGGAFLCRPAAIRYRMLRLALEQAGCRSAERRHFCRLSDALAEGHGAVALPGGFCAAVDGGRLTVRCVRRPVAENAEQPEPLRLALCRLPARFCFAGKSAELTVVSAEVPAVAENVHKMFFKYAVDCDKIQGSLQIRCRAAGDYLHPAGRGVGKTVKALMNEEHIPADRRGSLPLLCDDAGIVLIPGVTCDERVRTGPHTKHFLVWQWTDGL